MSRIGKQPISLPQGVSVKLADQVVSVEGPRGTLQQSLTADIQVSVEKERVLVSRPTEQKRHKALHGLYRTLIQNMIIGVDKGYTKELELIGVGYKASHQGNILELNLGYSHAIYMSLPAEVSVRTEAVKGKGTSAPRIVLESIDKQLLGQVVAKIRSLRPVEPYKGKGVRFVGEHVRRKAGKTAAKKA